MRNRTFLRFLLTNGLVFACAESCTGGGIARKITSVAGSSQVFWGGAVVYSNEAKRIFLGVSDQVLDQFGAVSGPCALAMAEGLARVTGVPINLSVTGVAGPGGGSPDKPVGTVWFAVAGTHGSLAVQMKFPGNRRSVQRQAVHFGRRFSAAWWKSGGTLDSLSDISDNERNCFVSSFSGRSSTE